MTCTVFYWNPLLHIQYQTLLSSAFCLRMRYMCSSILVYELLVFSTEDQDQRVWLRGSLACLVLWPVALKSHCAESTKTTVPYLESSMVVVPSWSHWWRHISLIFLYAHQLRLAASSEIQTTSAIIIITSNRTRLEEQGYGLTELFLIHSFYWQISFIYDRCNRRMAK